MSDYRNKMKIPVPKTLRGAFSPTIIVNLAFGIGVLEYPLGKPRPIISAIWSIINVLIYMSFIGFVNFSQIQQFKGSLIMIGTYKNGLFLCAIVISTSLCLSQAKSKILRCNFQTLNVINDRLKKLGVPDDYDWTFKAQIIHFTAGFAYIFTLVVLDYFNASTEFPNEFSRISLLLASYQWLAFSFVVNSGWTNIFGYFCNRFQRLNSLLVESDLLKILDSPINQEPNNRVLQHSLTLGEIHGNLPSNKSTGWQGMLHFVAETRKIHRDLCTTATELNKAFGIQILLSLKLSIYLITALFYNAYILAMGLLKIPHRHIALLMTAPLLWIIFTVIEVFLVTHTGEMIKRKARGTGQLVHTLLNSTLIYNEDVRDELTTFSLQMIHNPLQVTACGFFIVDHELAYMMLGTILTHLIVLIQMQSIYER